VAKSRGEGRKSEQRKEVIEIPFFGHSLESRKLRKGERANRTVRSAKRIQKELKTSHEGHERKKTAREGTLCQGKEREARRGPIRQTNLSQKGGGKARGGMVRSEKKGEDELY